MTEKSMIIKMCSFIEQKIIFLIWDTDILYMIQRQCKSINMFHTAGMVSDININV